MTAYAQFVHVNGEIGDVDDELILGPFSDGFQLTYCLLRETYNGDNVAEIRNGEWFTMDGRGPFSDVSFSEVRPASVLP